MGLINLVKFKRSHHGNYEAASDSERQTSISYTLPDQDGEFVHVCRKTFMNVFDVTQKRLVGLINKKQWDIPHLLIGVPTISQVSSRKTTTK